MDEQPKTEPLLDGPRQAEAATSEKIDRNVGGADYHMQFSGSADTMGADDEETIAQCRELIRYLPQNFLEKAPDRLPRDTRNKSEKLPRRAKRHNSPPT